MCAKAHEFRIWGIGIQKTRGNRDMAKINFLKALLCLCIMLSCGSFAGCGGEKDSGEGIQNSR